ncbi:MAG: prepilin-type N-terminal cleavage/methylation domain-containing protein [Planctomycetota bacterium]|nr:prepilin-type N-terminal cleavage/methylation domain-containing protein [Planctomycetota bacterium]
MITRQPIGKTRVTRGLTLIEILLATAVLAIVMVGLGMAFMSGTVLSESTSNESIANNIAMDKLEEVIGFAKLHGNAVNGFPYRVPGYTYDSVPTGIVEHRSAYLDDMIAYYCYHVGQSGTSSCLFSIPDLTPPPGLTAAGKVIIYLNENRVPVEIVPAAEQGAVTSEVDSISKETFSYTHMDLNGDGAYENLAVPLDGVTIDVATPAPAHKARVGRFNVDIVPVEVRIQWKTRQGVHTVRRFTLVARTSR